jgi:hypothetical protein
MYGYQFYYEIKLSVCNIGTHSAIIIADRNFLIIFSHTTRRISHSHKLKIFSINHLESKFGDRGKFLQLESGNEVKILRIQN